MKNKLSEIADQIYVLLNTSRCSKAERDTLNEMIHNIRSIQYSQTKLNPMSARITMTNTNNPMLVKMATHLAFYYHKCSTSYIMNMIMLRTMMDNYHALRTACGNVAIPYSDFAKFIIDHVDPTFSDWRVPLPHDIITGTITVVNKSNIISMSNNPTIDEIKTLIDAHGNLDVTNTNIAELPKNLVVCGDLILGPVTGLPENLVVLKDISYEDIYRIKSKNFTKMGNIELPHTSIVGGNLNEYVTDTREYRFAIGETVNNMVFVGDRLIEYRSYHKVGAYTIYYVKGCRDTCVVVRGNSCFVVPRNKAWICRAMISIWAIRLWGMPDLGNRGPYIPDFYDGYAELDIDEPLTLLNAIRVYCAVSHTCPINILRVIPPREIKLTPTWTIRSIIDYAEKYNLPRAEAFKEFYIGDRMLRWWHED